MKVPFDEGTPAPLRKAIVAHQVETPRERSGAELQNGELIAATAAAGFEVFITTDRNRKYPQNLADRQLAIVVLLTTSWARIRQALPAIVQAADAATPRTTREVSVPRTA